MIEAFGVLFIILSGLILLKLSQTTFFDVDPSLGSLMFRNYVLQSGIVFLVTFKDAEVHFWGLIFLLIVFLVSDNAYFWKEKFL